MPPPPLVVVVPVVVPLLRLLPPTGAVLRLALAGASGMVVVVVPLVGVAAPGTPRLMGLALPRPAAEIGASVGVRGAGVVLRAAMAVVSSAGGTAGASATATPCPAACSSTCLC
jgi:hypothetical protein